MSFRRQSRSVSPDIDIAGRQGRRSFVDERSPLEASYRDDGARGAPEIELDFMNHQREESPIRYNQASSSHDHSNRSGPSSQSDEDGHGVSRITHLPKAPSPAPGPPASQIRTATRRQRGFSSRLYSLHKDWWFSDIAIFLLSVALLVAIVGILAHYDGYEYPSWPAGITLNAIVSVLVTIAAFLTAMNVGSCMGQLKWNHVRYPQQASRLWDFCAIHDAGGQPTAALKLFISWNGFLPLLGAVLVVLNQALGPFVQQLIQQETTSLALTEKPSVPIMRDLTMFIGPGSAAATDIGIPMRAAIYQGLYTTVTKPFFVTPNCPSGNCTWPSYTSLSICSSCDDISDQITAGSAMDTWTLPTGLTLSPGVRQILNTQTNSTSFPGILDLKMIGQDIGTGQQIASRPNPSMSELKAAQCSMRFCTETMQGRSINGIFNETVLSRNETWNYELNQNTANGTFDNVGMGSVALRNWFHDAFNFSYVTIDSSGGLQAPPPSTFGGGSPSSAPDYAAVLQRALSPSSQTGSDFNVSSLFDNVARSMQQTLRMQADVKVTLDEGVEQIEGTQTRDVVLVSIQWGWIALPIVLYVGIALLLAATMVQTRMLHADVWKDSSIAMLMHGLCDELRAEASAVTTGSEMSRTAKQMRVRLVSTDHGWELGSTSQMS